LARGPTSSIYVHSAKEKNLSTDGSKQQIVNLTSIKAGPKSKNFFKRLLQQSPKPYIEVDYKYNLLRMVQKAHSRLLKNNMFWNQGCQIFLSTKLPDAHKIYQIAVIYPKWS
jgi:hypothetical protein